MRERKRIGSLQARGANDTDTLRDALRNGRYDMTSSAGQGTARSYVRYSDDVDVVAPGEQETIDKIIAGGTSPDRCPFAP